jgi:hypothetical protein
MTLIRICLFLLIATQMSCNTEGTSNCKSPTSDEVINRYKDLLDISSNESDLSELKVYTDKQFLPVKGGQYSFYRNNVLKSYSFYQNSTTARYREDFDQNGLLNNREGNPILFTKIEEVSKDTLVFNLYVSILTIRPINVFILINKTDTIAAAPTNEISFSNSISYQAGIKMVKHGKVDFRTTLIYSNCKGEHFSILDSGYIYH